MTDRMHDTKEGDTDMSFGEALQQLANEGHPMNDAYRVLVSIANTGVKSDRYGWLFTADDLDVARDQLASWLTSFRAEPCSFCAMSRLWHALREASLDSQVTHIQSHTNIRQAEQRREWLTSLVYGPLAGAGNVVADVLAATPGVLRVDTHDRALKNRVYTVFWGEIECSAV